MHWSVASHTHPSPTGKPPQPSHVSQLGIEPAAFGFTGWSSVHWATWLKAHYFFPVCFWLCVCVCEKCFATLLCLVTNSLAFYIQLSHNLFHEAFLDPTRILSSSPCTVLLDPRAYCRTLHVIYFSACLSSRKLLEGRAGALFIISLPPCPPL